MAGEPAYLERAKKARLVEAGHHGRLERTVEGLTRANLKVPNEVAIVRKRLREADSVEELEKAIGVAGELAAELDAQISAARKAAAEEEEGTFSLFD